MTKAQQIEAIQRSLAVQEELLAILSKHQVSGEQSEAILLWIAGVMAGTRQVPIINNEWSAPALLGWKRGASFEPVR